MNPHRVSDLKWALETWTYGDTFSYVGCVIPPLPGSDLLLDEAQLSIECRLRLKDPPCRRRGCRISGRNGEGRLQGYSNPFGIAGKNSGRLR